MNRFHRWFCRSAQWRRTVEQRVPWVVSDVPLGHRVLELGPGPGLTTDFLRQKSEKVIALELDPGLASSLRTRLLGSNADVVTGDATAMPFPDETFSGVVAFTMLHHVPSPELQDKVFRQAWRVLEPGGVFVGSDSLQSWRMRLIHIGDTLVPVDPKTLGARLEAAGFSVVAVERGADAFRFHARKVARTETVLPQEQEPVRRKSHEGN